MRITLGSLVFLFILSSHISPVFAADYYVSPGGVDSNPGSISAPWKTMKKAVESLRAGDALFVRSGIYETIEDAWRFQNTGTDNQPITVRNYPNEQAIFKINSLRMERRAFRCGANTAPIGSANHIKLIGSDVAPRTLSNGIVSSKGLVVLGLKGANAIGVEGNLGGCNYWEIAGFDFIETGGGIFQRLGPSTNWHVHDNRVYNYYRESGMQFNGHYNIVENNQIYLVNSLPRTYGCQTINLVGHNNIIRNNYLTRGGSTHRCLGVLFEWDLSDDNIITNNTIEDVSVGIGFFGGDRNQITHNVIKATPGLSDSVAFNIVSYDNFSNWPCNEMESSLASHLPPNDTKHPEYVIYYSPRNCHSHSNTIRGNQIIGFASLLRQGPVTDSTNVVASNGGDSPPPSPALTPAPAQSPYNPGDLNSDGKVNIFDYNILISNFNKTGSFGFIPSDISRDGKVDTIDYNMVVANFGK